MKRLICIVVVLFFAATLMMAQDAPKTEVFGGYTYSRVNYGGEGINANGWNAQMTEFFQKNLGLTADFTGIYKSGSAAGITGNAHDHLFMFGPTYRIPAKHATIFAHALFGESHWSGTGDFLFGSSSATDNAFAMAFGGGVDYNIHKHIAVRVAQLDFVQTYHADTNQNNFRYSGGIVFKF